MLKFVFPHFSPFSNIGTYASGLAGFVISGEIFNSEESFIRLDHSVASYLRLVNNPMKRL